MSSIVQHAPRFAEGDAVRIAKDLFALDATAKLLPSERDQNFRLTASNGQAYVLKIANSTELEAVLDFQNQAMIYIRDKCGMLGQNNSVAPQVCLSLSEEQITSTQDSDGTTYL